MLETILSISGKPGLYKIVSQGKNMIIVESLLNGKRGPAYAHEKIISLSDIAIFTEDGEKPLFEVLDSIKTKENGQKTSVDPKSEAKILKEYLAEVLPNFDRERVYPTDIKKMLTWYNLLVETGNADFTAKKQEEEKNEEA
ncbi:MAG: DUF5606 domain-containing protein [Bacteroidaceae bacterium]|nr:DUF5606 domain-containing protein [Bacteroidaceae bacterium]